MLRGTEKPAAEKVYKRRIPYEQTRAQARKRETAGFQSRRHPGSRPDGEGGPGIPQIPFRLRRVRHGRDHEDNSLKPSYLALQQLIHGEWETHETLTADAEGFIEFTGFKGGYTVSTGDGSAPFTLEEDTAGKLVLEA